MIMISIIGYVLLLYLIYCSVVPFVLSFAGQFKSIKSENKVSKKRKILILIPAYKEDCVIVETALQTLKQNYPKKLYSVVVIADSLLESTIDKLSNLNIQIHKVVFKKSTKVKALNHAIGAWMDRSYEGVVILDADNIMDNHFLSNINDSLNNGMLAIQGQRKAKNIESKMAFLDGVSEDINNHIYCKGAYNLGLSSRLAGSGMAFSPEVLKDALKESQAVGGFDKELELKLTSKRIKIHYVEEAIIYDEKVSYENAFTNQRTRWIQAQYQYLSKHLKDGLWNGIKTFNMDYVYKIFLLALPPKLLLPLILFITSLIWTVMTGSNKISWILWILLTANLTSFIIAIPKSYLRKEHIVKWLGLLSAVILTLKALGNLSMAKRSFLHTPHGRTSYNKNQQLNS